MQIISCKAMAVTIHSEDQKADGFASWLIGHAKKPINQILLWSQERTSNSYFLYYTLIENFECNVIALLNVWSNSMNDKLQPFLYEIECFRFNFIIHLIKRS